ncbi:MAG: carbohydrate binding domain-containing protein, partial [Thermoguttaceae bacterium]
MNCLVALILALGAGQLPHLDDFAVNPSFESDLDRDDLPDGWRGSAYESPAVLEWSGSVAHSGSRSLMIRDSYREGDSRDWKQCSGRWSSGPRPIVAGTEYTLAVWIKTAGVTGKVGAHLAWQKGSGWLSEIATPAVTGTSDWQRVTVSGVAPADADAVVISLNHSRSKGTAWFDDVKVTGASEMPPEVPYTFNETSDWFPFAFKSDDTNLDTIDLTGLLDGPAGRHGFVTVRDDGHFWFEDGTRARFFGTNVGGAECAPPKEEARRLAARLAKYGVNMLRLHSMDGRWGPLLPGDAPTSQDLDAEALDRIDFFVNELKRRGIYVYMDLLDYRWFRTADGVAHGDEFSHNWAGSMKGASIFDPRMIELQKEYATKLLTHRNPYTGLRYVDEPAMAVVETTNENSIFYFLRNKDLSLPYYRLALEKRWNGWLLDRYKSRPALTKAWTDGAGREALAAEEDPAQGTVAFMFGAAGRMGANASQGSFDPLVAPARVGDGLRFLCDVQRSYYRQMHGHLKQMGVRAPIAGTNQSFFVADTEVEASENDFISRNQYWRHPNRDARPFFKFSNEAMLEVDLPAQRDPLSVIAATSVAGKPQAVAEFNFPWPNEYRAEGLLLASAYSCLQDWDIFLLFSYGTDETRLSMFQSSSDPARWGEFPAAALMFHRQDVSPGKNEIHVVHTPGDSFTPRPNTALGEEGDASYLTFLSKVRTAFVEDAYRGKADAILAAGPSVDAAVEGDVKVIRIPERPWDECLFGRFVAAAREQGLVGYAGMDGSARRLDSDTGELSLDYGRGLLTINTPRTQGAVGRLGTVGSLKLDGLEISCQTPFAAI